MNYDANIKRIREIMVRLRMLETANNIMFCDQWHAGPEAGFDQTTNVEMYLSELTQQLVENDEVKQLVADFADFDKDQYKSDIDRGMVRYLSDRYKNATLIPLELGEELGRINNDGRKAWHECKKNNDFKGFKPYLQKQFEVQKRVADAINPNESAFQVLVNCWDADWRLEEIDKIFGEVKPEIVSLLKKTESYRDSIDPSVIDCDVDRETKERIVRKLMDYYGFNWNQGILYEEEHPSCVCAGPRDSRPSTNYSRNLFYTLLGAAHETGHGIYNYGSSQEVVDAGLWGGIDGSMHESQSKFYEDQVGRSLEFWTAFYPEIQKEVPKFRDIPVETVVRALNKPNPGWFRMQADELTVPLHLILRYEMERDYFSGKLSIDDMEEAWNTRYKEYLGVTPKNASEGILQEVHWSTGFVGYFQGYALGLVYSCQYRNSILKAHPDAWKKLAKGDISDINSWLAEHIHSLGQTYTTRETIIKATGEDVNTKYYLEYLRGKFTQM